MELFALLRSMSFDARQQFFFEKGSALPEPLALHLVGLEEINDFTVLVTKRIEAWLHRHKLAHGLFIPREPCQQ